MVAALLTAVVAGGCGADPLPTAARPAPLADGPPPRTPATIDDTLYTGAGTVTLPHTEGGYQVLGGLDGRYLVDPQAGDGLTLMSVAATGQVRRLGTYPTYGGVLNGYAAGRLYLQLSDRGTGESTVSQVDARTGRVVRRIEKIAPSLVGTVPTGGLLDGDDGIELWRPDGSRRRVMALDVGEHPALIDLERDLAILSVDEVSGKTSTEAVRVSEPSRVLWKAGADLHLSAISPDGRSLAAQGDADGGRVQVRRSADGSLVRRFDLTRDGLVADRITFEDSATLLLSTETATERGDQTPRYALVRCHLATGHCEQAGPSGSSTSVP